MTASDLSYTRADQDLRSRRGKMLILVKDFPEVFWKNDHGVIAHKMHRGNKWHNGTLDL